MPTGCLSDAEELSEMDLRGLQLDYAVLPRSKRRPRGEPCPSLDNSSAAEEDDDDDDEEEDEDEECGARKRRRRRPPGAPVAVEGHGGKRQQAASGRGAVTECKQTQRNAANARERARMRVLSKAFSRLKTSLPWVPPDTKLSKLDTLRLASSYIAHLRQLLQEDRYEKGFVHPVNLTWPFVVSGRPESTPKRFLQPTDYVELQLS
ncbi:LOW QUALITY PROTEIN: musculin [Sphaerodactylus townsendi]|uniref:LOW QUALITY PROTEIN: musculin n=1 Tax=Sphaerodactylus townsendi TaxID=933632 RepID=UPI0020270D13|nr:LOW QUALITY PROTEIN: musculin [Sphaerodactylus townsendi]